MPAPTTPSSGRSTDRRSRRRRRLVVPLAAATVALLVPAAAGALPSHASHAGRVLVTRHAAVARAGARYARLVPDCPRAVPGQVQCLAVRRELVPLRAGQPVPAGVTELNPQDGLGSGPSGGYTPKELESLYDFNRTSGGKGQTVAIVDFYDDPSARADLRHFDAYYGLRDETSTSFRKVNQKGGASPLPAANKDSAGEIALDIETVRAACATCRIVLVEASSNRNSDIATAEDEAAKLKPTEISNSFGGPERLTSAGKRADRAFEKAFVHPGIVITASTGDEGWYGYDFINTTGGVSDSAAYTPAAFPSVTAVGGTSVGITSEGKRLEYVWDEDGPGDENGFGTNHPGMASGGGCSQEFTAPGWQKHVGGYSATGCGSRRLAGDVAAIGDPATGFDVYDSYGSGGWVTVGGTSLSSPFVASLWALAGGSHGVKNPSLTLYGNEKSHGTSRRDITLGGNGFCDGASATTCESRFNPAGPVNDEGYGDIDCSFALAGRGGAIVKDDHQCQAAKGYDGPSGVGTPKGLRLFAPLHPSAAIHAPKRLHRKGKAHFRGSGKDPFPGGRITSYSWSWGDGHHSKGRKVSHTFGSAGKYTVRLTVTDSYGQKKTVTKKVTVRH